MIVFILSACGSNKAESEVKVESKKQENTSDGRFETEPRSERQTEKETAKIIKNLEIINNGKTVVQYGGDVYYWKYNKESFEHQALWASYKPVPTAQNQLVCRREDGSEEIILTACAKGNLYFMGDRLYFESLLSENNTRYDTEIKWIEKKGEKWDVSVINSLGIGQIVDVDIEKKVILFLTDGADGLSDLYLINSEKSDERILIDQLVHYLTYEDGIIYYQKKIENASNAQRGEISIWSCDLQFNKKEIVHTKPDLYDYVSGTSAGVECFQIFDGNIYFSYGKIDGSARAYQGGNICKIPTDGGIYEILATEAQDLFYVYYQNGEVKIEQKKN